MIPYTVARFGAGHADVDRPLGNIASATYLRTLLRADRLLDALPYIPAGPARFPVSYTHLDVYKRQSSGYPHPRPRHETPRPV